MRRVPVLWRISPSAAGLAVPLGLGMGVWVEVLLWELRRWAHVAMGLSGLLPGQVIGVGWSSLLVVVGVFCRTEEGVDVRVVVRVGGRLRHGPGHVGLVVLWVRWVPGAVRTHGSIRRPLGVSRRCPRLSLYAVVAAPQLRLMGVGTKGLINTIRSPKLIPGLMRNRSALSVGSTRGLTGSLISMVCWAGLGG